MSLILSKRLQLIASLVPKGAVVGDIGTDHALLPIWLIENSKITKAFAADIGEGPLSRAEENIKAHGLSDKIITRLTDGLTGLEGLGINTFIIAGMGGELIASILERGKFIKKEKQTLILQPMSHRADARRWLLENGYSFRERLVFDGKLYTVIKAAYSGEEAAFSPGDCELGIPFIETRGELYLQYLQGEIKKYKRIIEGKRSAEIDCSREKNFLEILEGEVNENGNY